MKERLCGDASFFQAGSGVLGLAQDGVGLRDPPRLSEGVAELDLDADTLPRLADSDRERPLEQVGGRR